MGARGGGIVWADKQVEKVRNLDSSSTDQRPRARCRACIVHDFRYTLTPTAASVAPSIGHDHARLLAAVHHGPTFIRT
jgi:hypothetical protein